jgi:hypothetical protein
MKATIEKTNTGLACGKQRIRVESNSGDLLGWIQVTNVDWSPILGATIVYVVQLCHNGNYGCYLGTTLAEAFSKLGVSLKELDNSELPDGIYDEFCFKRTY